MKTFLLIILLGCLAFLLLSLIALESSMLMDINRTQEREIEGLKKHNEQERDSLETALKVTQDSLEIAFESIRQATAEREKAHIETQRLIKRYEKLIFVRFANDSARVRAIAELYPSFRHN